MFVKLLRLDFFESAKETMAPFERSARDFSRMEGEHPAIESVGSVLSWENGKIDNSRELRRERRTLRDVFFVGAKAPTP